MLLEGILHWNFQWRGGNKLIHSGIDIIEIGVPFSDPMKDGPIIQDAFLKTLNSGITPRDCLNLVKTIREKI